MHIADNKIESERLRAGLTQQELAGVVGVDVAAIQQWEQGDFAKAPCGYAIQLSEYFGCSIDYLLGLCDGRIQTRE